MRVLVTGATGQLGYDVVKELEKRNIDCLGVGRKDFDITDEAATSKFIRKYRPDAVVHCSAYTAVDKAEEDLETCARANIQGTENIARACKALGAKMIYISTDYVFPGTGDKFYEPNDELGPNNVYGLTKMSGEVAVRENCPEHFIVRISWVFGKNGNNFVKTMLRLGAEREELNVVSDQVGSPTYTVDLAKLLCDMLASDKYGTYHATNEDICSWADFAAEIMRQAGLKCRIKPIPTCEYPTPAIRPLNSRLSKAKLDKAGFSRLPSWQDALQRYLKELHS